MSIKTLSLRASALALFAAFAFAATEPALAAPAKGKATSSSHSDAGKAHRHHHAQRSTTRNAYGAYMGSPFSPEQTSRNYGYGDGDNARNQTW